MLQAGLTVVHSILLHVHERGVRISLAVAVALAKYLQMPVVLIKLWEALLLYLAYSLAELLVRHALLVHLLKDAVRTAHPAQPHEEHVLFKQRSHATTGIDVCQVGIHDYLSKIRG